MSDSNPPMQLTRNPAALLGPGIVGLFVQGIESGLVLAELFRWLLRDRRGTHFMSIILVFVTVVGLYVFSQTLNCVASS